MGANTPPPPYKKSSQNQGGGLTGVQPPPPHPKFIGGCDPTTPPLFGAPTSPHSQQTHNPITPYHISP